MPPTLTIVLLVLAFTLFCLATFGVAARVNLLAAGLACWTLVQLLAILMGK